MSSPDLRGDSVLRQPAVASGGRRLPGFADRAAAVSASKTQGSDAQQLLVSLREQFASELAVLKEEARLQGAAAARKEAEEALRVAKADLTRQWQQKEDEQRQAMEQSQQHVMALATALRERHEQVTAEMEPIVSRLALTVAAKLIGQHQVARPLVVDLATQAIEAYRLGTVVQVRVAAADYDRIQLQYPAEELLQFLKVDHQVEPGSCLIDYGRGQLDASLETQWAAIKAVVLQTQTGAGRVVSA